MSVGEARKRAREFLREAHLYRLGNLPTERPHPATYALSDWARNDLGRAISVLKGIDLDALRVLESRAADIQRLAEAVRSTLARGRRVFLCGCGATGRLALTLESLWRQANPDSEQVQAFMAGGDVALVHSLEGFEDRAEYGERHLSAMRFLDGDLLIACTEGGETPYVIGATRAAAGISSNRPYFLYCNPDFALRREVERFRTVYDDRRIQKVCLHVGPMALAGSTRMQASTVLQLAVGAALLHPDVPVRVTLQRYRDLVEATDFGFLAAFVEREAGTYSEGRHVLYRVRDLGITVFTDTTERAPTFSLLPFQRNGAPVDSESLCYVVLDGARSPTEAWRGLLHRTARALDWRDVDGRTTSEYLNGFDFSARAERRRLDSEIGARYRCFDIRRETDGISLRLGDLAHQVPTGEVPDLVRHTLLKQMLNLHSTLVMGRLGRYKGNLMTWVWPSNGKLVDRAARYVTQLLRRTGQDASYEQVVQRLFEEIDRVEPDESVVVRTWQSLLLTGTDDALPTPAVPDRPSNRPGPATKPTV